MVSADQFKDAMAEFPSGVTIVTTARGGAPFGMTVAAFCSVSLDPPLVLVSIAHSASSHGVLTEAGRFAVHLLGADQADLARRFAGPSTMDDRFGAVAWRSGAGGVPLLPGCLVVLECALEAAVPAGDHTLFVGRVLAVPSRLETGRALVFHRRTFDAVGSTKGLSGEPR